MKIIYTRKSEEILVDDEDYEELSQFKWYIGSHGYAVRTIRIEGKRRHILMHRYVMKLEHGDPREADHRNTYRLDNQKLNLRVCTSQQNKQTTRVRKRSASGLKGVYYDAQRNKWQAYICVNRKRVHLGRFKTTEEAHAAYCSAALKIGGEFANFGIHVPGTGGPLLPEPPCVAVQVIN